MKKIIVTCFHLPSMRHLILWFGIPLAMSFTFSDCLYAGSAGNIQEFSQIKNRGNESSRYGRQYTRSILHGVTLSDVYTFNDTETTEFGPAYANVWTIPSNFLACMPPTGRKFSYALCYYSGPDAPTGNNPDNASLPCKLSADGVVANCSCYEIATEVVSPKIPYYVDINAISNLEIYQETLDTCGQTGEKCSHTDRDPPVCDAINANLLVPGADLISVFSPVYARNYFNRGENNSTACVDGAAGIYAGCMTAPCYRTGQKDANGRDIVECKCPVFDGPYQIGQADQNCNANEPPPDTTTPYSKKKKIGKTNVWSAAFNPAGGPITPPVGACVPDLPGDSGCELFDPQKDYGQIVDPDGTLCANVCAAYEGSATNAGIQVGYSCDATLCTTLGIGQENNPDFPPPRDDQIRLLDEACSNIQDMNGMKQVMLVEALAECSCCASQVCGCENINEPTNTAIFDLNQQQLNAGIQPQCKLNGTLCGEEDLQQADIR